MTAIPETIRGNRFSWGKCGSNRPVTGLRSTAGARAAKVGLGRSWNGTHQLRYDTVKPHIKALGLVKFERNSG